MTNSRQVSMNLEGLRGRPGMFQDAINFHSLRNFMTGYSLGLGGKAENPFILPGDATLPGTSSILPKGGN